ncbi:hypothetical protein OIU79_002694 [Salix purpurea]|uniref:Uncharacterized protein n=1 Tax=Salix purpurea TaxID=77065 RepID=A0A9Q0UKC8_SALPP|nr:hypothetical protein OIU79_002694 [Salix purpurea]
MPPSSGLQHASSLGTPSPAWMMSQSSPQQAPSGMQFAGHQAVGGFGSDGAAFGAVNMDQQVASRFSAPPTPQPFSSVGGNPFG